MDVIDRASCDILIAAGQAVPISHAINIERPASRASYALQKTTETNDVCFLEPFEPSMQQPVMPHACVLPAVMLLELMPNTQKETDIRKPTNMSQTYNS